MTGKLVRDRCRFAPIWFLRECDILPFLSALPIAVAVTDAIRGLRALSTIFFFVSLVVVVSVDNGGDSPMPWLLLAFYVAAGSRVPRASEKKGGGRGGDRDTDGFRDHLWCVSVPFTLVPDPLPEFQARVVRFSRSFILLPTEALLSRPAAAAELCLNSGSRQRSKLRGTVDYECFPSCVAFCSAAVLLPHRFPLFLFRSFCVPVRSFVLAIVPPTFYFSSFGARSVLFMEIVS